MEDDVTNPVMDNDVVQPEVAATPEAEIETDAGEENLDPVDEDIEVEREGKKYRVPKALEKELMLNADYTRKTQTLADDRRAFEAQQAQFKQHTEAQHAFIQDVAKLHAMQDQLAQFEKIDWNTLEQSNPQEANRLWRQRTLLKDQFEQTGRDLSQRQQQRQLDEQQETAKRIEQGRAKLAERIPNWSEDTAAKLVDYGAKEFGFTRDELSGIVDPRAVETLYWAKFGKEQYTKQRTAASKPQQPEPVPVPTVAAKRPAPTTNLYAITDPDKWAEVRNKQEAAKRNANRR